MPSLVRQPSLRLLVGLVALTLLAACQPDHQVASSKSSPTARASRSASSITPAAGGLVRGEGAAVYVPPGALTKAAAVTVDHGAAPTSVFDALATEVGEPVRVTVEGGRVRPHVPVTLPVPAAETTGRSLMFLATIDGAGKVHPLVGVTKASTGSITADVALPATVAMYRWDVDAIASAVDRELVAQRAAGRSVTCPVVGTSTSNVSVRVITRVSTGDTLCHFRSTTSGPVTLTLTSRGGAAVTVATTGRMASVAGPGRTQHLLKAEENAYRAERGGGGVLPAGGSLTLKVKARSTFATGTYRVAGLGEAVDAALSADPEVSSTEGTRRFFACLYEDQVNAQTMAGAPYCATATFTTALGNALFDVMRRHALIRTLAAAYQGVSTHSAGLVDRLPRTWADAPVLGVHTSYDEGFGYVKPSKVWTGGDGSSEINRVHWTSWGAAEAVGAGQAEWTPPSSQMRNPFVTSATVVAYDVGKCDGRLTYRRITWYFPQFGEHFHRGDGFGTCHALSY